MYERKYATGEFGDIVKAWADYINPTNSYTFRGQLVNTDDYDIIPKRSTVERQIKIKEEEINRLKTQRDNELKYYESQEKKLNLELEQLKQRLSG